MGRPKAPLEDCLQRIQVNPKDLELKMILGMAYRLRGDYRAALETWKSILDINPAHGPAKQLIQSLQAERLKTDCGQE